MRLIIRLIYIKALIATASFEEVVCWLHWSTKGSFILVVRDVSTAINLFWGTNSKFVLILSLARYVLKLWNHIYCKYLYY